MSTPRPPVVGERGPRVTRRPVHTPWWALLALASLGLATLPLAYLLIRVAGISGTELAEILLRPRVGSLVLNTMALGAAVAVTSLVFGVLIAVALTRAQLAANRFLLVATALPLAVPSYLASYGWLVWNPGLSGFLPSWLLLAAVTVPYVALPATAALRGLTGDHERVARTLGLSALQAFRRATWPQLRPAALAGALLAFLYTVSDFGLVAMLRFQTLTWGVNQAYSSSFDRSQAAVLALLVVVLAVAAVVGERRARRVVPAMTTRTQRVGPPLSRSLRALFLTIVSLPPLVGVVAPLGGLGLRLAQADTLRAIDLPGLVQATVWTVVVSVIAAVLAISLALPIAALAARFSTPFSRTVESLGYLSHALPGIVVGLSLVFFSLRVVPALYQTLAVLVFAYAVLFMSKAIGTTRSAIEVVSPALVHVARTLGESAFGAWRRVTLPLALPGIMVGALLVMIATMKELPATLILRPTGVDTLATELWSKTAILEYGAAAPYAAVLVVIAAIPAMLLSGARAEREGQ